MPRTAASDVAAAVDLKYLASEFFKFAFTPQQMIALASAPESESVRLFEQKQRGRS